MRGLELVQTMYGLGAVECAGKPGVWVPGAVEPYQRTLPTARAERVRMPKGTMTFLPDWVEDRGQYGLYTDPTSTPIELPVDRASLDALARMVGGVQGIIAGKDWDELVWRNGQYKIDVRWLAAAIFRALRAWGDLPQDTQLASDAGMPWAGWPDGKSRDVRLIYAWHVGAAPDYAITQLMQVQKWVQQHGWLVFNQWGTDLTFSRTSPRDNFSAGFDLGTWVTQHQCELGGGVFTAFNAVYTALCTLVSFGAYGAPAAASLALGQAVQKTAGAIAQAASTGDWAGVFAGIGQVAAALAGIPLETGGTLGEKVTSAFLEQNKWVLDNPIARGVVSLIPSSGSTELTELIGKAITTGKAIKSTVELTQKAFTDFQSQISSLTDRYYTTLGWNTGKTAGPVLAVRETVPWYAVGAFDMGAAAGTLMLVQQGGTPAGLPVRAARVHRPPMPPAVGVPGSKTWIVAGLLGVGAAAAAAHYTGPGRAAWAATKVATKGAYRAVANKPRSVQIMGGVAAASVLTALYVLTRKKDEAPSEQAMAPSTLPTSPTSTAFKRF